MRSRATATTVWRPSGAWRPGAYRALATWTDGKGSSPQETSGWSTVLSAEQYVSTDVAVFGRFTRSWDRLPERYRGVLSVGTVWERPFGSEADRVGIAYAWIDPTEPADANEHLVEIYWRSQLTSRVQLTPDLQLWAPGRATGVRVVGGLRLRVTF